MQKKVLDLAMLTLELIKAVLQSFEIHIPLFTVVSPEHD